MERAQQKTYRRTATVVATPTLAILAGCSDGRLSALDPAGPAASSIATIWHIMAWSSAAILVLMIVLAARACLRRPRDHERSPGRLLLIGGGLVFPGVVLLALLIYGLRASDIQAPLFSEHGVYRVHVQAHQWWWEVTYPDAPDGPRYGINQIHVPAGAPFHVTVTSNDVIHSFWIPRLGGKIDAIPGRSNTIRLQADEPGVYDGVCAEFCGVAHANMTLQLTAHEEANLAQALQQLSLSRVAP